MILHAVSKKGQDRPVQNSYNSQEKIGISEQGKLDPVHAESNDICKSSRDNDKLDGFNGPPYPL